MRKAILNNWRAKLTCLALATLLWFLIKKNLEVPAQPAEFQFGVTQPQFGAGTTGGATKEPKFGPQPKFGQ